MSAPAVVKDFHVLEDCLPGRLPGREAHAVDELGLERVLSALAPASIARAELEPMWTAP